MNSDEGRNFLLAILIAIFVLIAWQYFYVIPQQEKLAEFQAEQQKMQKLGNNINQDGLMQDRALQNGVLQNGAMQNNGNIDDENQPFPLIDIESGKLAFSDKFINKQVEFKTREEAISATPRISIKTSNLRGSISLKGGLFNDLTLANYKQTLAENSDDVILLSPSATSLPYFAEFGFIPLNNSAKKRVDVPNKNTIWNRDSNHLTPNKPITLTYENSDGILFERQISVDDGFLFTIRQRVINNSDADVSLVPYGLISRAREDAKSVFVSHEGGLGVFDKIVEKLSYDKLKSKREVAFKNQSDNGWLAIADKYWLTAIIPQRGEGFDAKFSYYFKDNLNRYQADFLSNNLVVVPAGGGVAEYTSHFYAGAKKLALLEKYREEINVPLFDRAIDFGKLHFLTKPFFKAVKFFNELLGNFGLAIMALTVVIKAVLFPLAHKSYTSMAKLKELAPEIEILRKNHKGDKMQQSQAIMQFYKQKNINPASGCLPIILQIPIFFALYKTLYVTIEMRHAPFFGWIKDLSTPDPTSIFNLFGLFSYNVPEFLPVIGVLPLIFMATMYLQQAFNPTPSDETQALVMKLLPLIFLFMFAGFPAGLVLYWIWSNMLSIIQQFIIKRQIHKKYESGNMT